MKLYQWSFEKFHFVLVALEFLRHYQQALLATQLNIAPLCVTYFGTQLFLVKVIYAAPLMPPFKESQVFCENCIMKISLFL